MQSLPAIAGWQWIMRGFALFRRQPGAIASLFIFYISLTLLLAIVPLIGMVLSYVMIPTFSMAFMMACSHIERNQRITAGVLFSAFRSPQIKSLLILGVFYLLAIFAAMIATYLFDKGFFYQYWSAQANDPIVSEIKPQEEIRLAQSMLFCFCSYFFLTLSLWFAAPLIYWQKMSVGKALFFSFFAVLKSIKAFAVYILGWLMIGVFMLVIVGSLLQILQIGTSLLQTVIMLPFMVTLSSAIYCSFYPSYTQVFGSPHVSENA